MCGIAGIAALPGGPPPDRDRLLAMSATLEHRGPDDAGHHVAGSVALAARRLAILDLEGARQPFGNEDGTVRAVFNGEIYNFRELRRRLDSAGHRLRSRGDGEVLVHLAEEHGRGFPAELDGMFAAAVHDARRRRLWLVRDRLGIKPLYWVVAGGWLVFGSEVKALLASGLVAPRLDVDALGEFLAWEYVPSPRTLLRGVRKLEAGSLLELDLDSGETRVESYWDPLPKGEPEERTDAGWEEAVDQAVRAAVTRQLVSDVPLGAFLSGGVDSSLVTAAMAGAGGAAPVTFGIGFDDPSYDESPYAREVAAHLGVRHRQQRITPDAADLFDRLMPFLDDPIADFSIFPTYLVSRLAREEVKVALTGDGGDELFGGYEQYRAHGLARLWRRLPGFVRAGAASLAARLRPRPAKKGLVNKAKRFLEGVEHDPRLGPARWRLFAGAALQDELFTPEARRLRVTPLEEHLLALDRRAASAEAGGELTRALYADVKSYLVDNCLTKVDRASMACSLEARVPLLDHRLVELAFRVPERLKVSRGRTKVLLKRVAARHLPRRCVDRPKQGFSVPVKHWLGDPLRPRMEELLSPERLRADGLFDAATVGRLRREHVDGRANHSHLIWALMVFQDWLDRWRVAR